MGASVSTTSRSKMIDQKRDRGETSGFLDQQVYVRACIDSKVNSKKGITSTRCLNSKRGDNIIGKCKHLNVLSQTDVYNGPGAKPNGAPAHVADLSQDQQNLLATEEVAGYFCISHVGTKLDVFERKLDSFKSVIRSVETQLRILVSREVAFLEAVPIVDVAGPDAFDVNNGSVMKACLRQMGLKVIVVFL
ncbi:hypothetical protein DPMN_039663 [Dreissena polymorpha]|uniref:Uncharacterized protein n=1 Tax=Dreissena polymorpha TaxID=45954 RepID=A0A9D4HUK6_DREPO|nr:hypothetical protein DPMN_039663 [Dreissena polymorpha]